MMTRAGKRRGERATAGRAAARRAAVGRAALVILDGWGWAPPGPGNAISLARTPVWDALWARYPHVLLEASGEAVGLPPGVMGNSEVGHLTIGSGRIIYQDLSRINRAIADGSFFRNPVLGHLMDRTREREGSLHLLGLLSDAGVHSSVGHLKALVTMARDRGLKRIYVHAFTDGRDTSPTAGAGYVEELEAFLAAEGAGKIATVAGRYWAMDRDKRWDRVKRAYDALVHGEGLRAPNAVTAIAEAYARGETDEFIQPTVIDDDPLSRLRSGDGVVFFNFRPDRAREICAALSQEEFEGFDRGQARPRLEVVGLTEYDPKLRLPAAFPKEEPKNVLAEVLSEAGLSQLHVAETEKYAHVTFFFNGGRERPFPGETRCLVPSPKDVGTYDQKPEMSAYEVVECLVGKLAEVEPDFVVVNFANPDMVAHTGDIPATIKALEHVDHCLGRTVEALQAHGARILVTADHGNAECMLAADGSPDTAHTTNPVPLVILESGLALREGAGLADIAPTILCFMGLQVPREMTGVPLCEA
jgi:2,3-bisphosphoglycerate-independent phosphoglycerate mutase